MIVCSQNENQERNKNTQRNNLGIKTFEDLKFFTGDWIIKQYVDSIKQSNSPFRSQPYDISNVLIDSHTLKDRIIGFAWALHDGASNLLYFDDSKGIFVVYSEEDRKRYYIYELSFQNVGHDTLLSLYKLEEKYEIIFQRIPHHQELKTFIHSIVISGEYKVMFDELNLVDAPIVSFNSDGKIQGLRNFERYELCYDFNDDIPQRDLIIFTIAGERYWYSWEFVDNNLNIFEFNEKKISSESTIKRKIISLKRLGKA